MERAGEILKSILGEAGFRRGDRYVRFFRSWRDLVGEPLCDHTRIVDIENRAAIVEIDHPGWFQMFQFSEAKILRRIRAGYPELNIGQIKVRVVELERGDESRGTAGQEVANEAKRVNRIRLKSGGRIDDPSEVGGIQDGELRNVLARLYRSICERDGSDGGEERRG
jgi:hypothetical protein